MRVNAQRPARRKTGLAKNKSLCKVPRTKPGPLRIARQRSMKIAILKERRPHETRVAATPETVKKLKALGAEITIEAGAGTAAAYTDQAYIDAGAEIAPDAPSAMAAGDIVFKIQ